MNDTIIKVINEFNKVEGKHICYLYNDHQEYIEKVVTFIMIGIKEGDHILLVENDRNILAINRKLQNELSDGQLANLHIMNNYNFYFTNGNFHPHTILLYFSSYIQSFVENGISIRTWGHIEWGNEKEIQKDIEEYEKEVDKLVKLTGTISVCAYPAERTSDSLVEMLKNCHGVIITDHEVVYLN